MGYGTRAGADTYFNDRLNSVWSAGASPARDAALVRAADYVKFTYVRRFATGFDDTAPEVEAATYEAAVIELATPGFFSRTYTDAERKVLIEVEGIKWQVTGASSGARAMTPVSTKIEAMLWPYMARAYGAVTV